MHAASRTNGNINRGIAIHTSGHVRDAFHEWVDRYQQIPRVFQYEKEDGADYLMPQGSVMLV